MANKKISELTNITNPNLTAITPVVVNNITYKTSLQNLRQVLVDNGSHIFTGSQRINGDLTISGSLTAQQYIISSSYVNIITENISGSTSFGNSEDDTHTFTGSLSVNGSVTSNFFVGDGSFLTNLITSLPYEELYSLKNNSLLVPGAMYEINDYRTCYDRPNYDLNGDPILTENYVDSEVINPIILVAISNSQLSVDAYQKDYPLDKIKYDINRRETEHTNQPMYGKIIERIDEFNNRTDYDHRVVQFIRYHHYVTDYSSMFGGTIQVLNDGVISGTGTSFSELYIGAIISIPTMSPNIFKVMSIDSDTSMIITGNTSMNGMSTSSGMTYYSVVTISYVSYKRNNVDEDNDLVLNYTFDFNNFDYHNNHIRDTSIDWSDFELSNNVFKGDSCRHNYLGSNSVSNTFNYNCFNNTTNDYFSYNITNGNVDNNTIGCRFQDNVIIYDMTQNLIGDDFQFNVIQNEFSHNIIKNDFYSNLIYCGLNNEQFIRNFIGDSFSNNIIFANFFSNNIGDNFTSNLIGDDSLIGITSFFKNTIGNNFEFNETHNTFSDNLIGASFNNNIIYSSVQRNEINSYFEYNTISSFNDSHIFNQNNILSYFNDNLINASFYGNHVLNNFQDNQIFDDFYDNNIGDYFIGNTLSGNTFMNEIKSEFYYNNINFTFAYNKIGNLFYENVIDGYFGFGGSISRGNIIGNNFNNNIIREYFYDNKISDNFENNIVGYYFQYNEINQPVSSVDFNEFYGNIYDVSYSSPYESTDGTYTSISPISTSGNGSLATFDITLSGDTVQSVSIVNSGIEYNINDTLTLPSSSFGSLTNLILTVDSVSPTPMVYEEYNTTIEKGTSGDLIIKVFNDESDQFWSTTKQNGPNENVITSGYTYEFSGSVNLLNNINVNGITSIGSTLENILSLNDPTTGYTHDFSVSSIIYITGATSNIEIDIINVPSNLENKSIGLTVMVDQGVTSYMVDSILINSNGLGPVSIMWLGGSLPSGNPNSIDIITFSIVKINGTWKLFGQLTTF